MKELTTKGFDVFKNDKFLGFIAGQNVKVRKQLIKDMIKPTHMGQWKKTSKGYEYATTIGVYITFEKCKRISNMISNYRIKEI